MLDSQPLPSDCICVSKAVKSERRSLEGVKDVIIGSITSGANDAHGHMEELPGEKDPSPHTLTAAKSTTAQY